MTSEKPKTLADRVAAAIASEALDALDAAQKRSEFLESAAEGHRAAGFNLLWNFLYDRRFPPKGSGFVEADPKAQANLTEEFRDLSMAGNFDSLVRFLWYVNSMSHRPYDPSYTMHRFPGIIKSMNLSLLGMTQDIQIVTDECPAPLDSLFLYNSGFAAFAAAAAGTNLVVEQYGPRGARLNRYNNELFTRLKSGLDFDQTFTRFSSDRAVLYQAHGIEVREIDIPEEFYRIPDHIAIARGLIALGYDSRDLDNKGVDFLLKIYGQQSCDESHGADQSPCQEQTGARIQEIRSRRNTLKKIIDDETSYRETVNSLASISRGHYEGLEALRQARKDLEVQYGKTMAALAEPLKQLGNYLFQKEGIHDLVTLLHSDGMVPMDPTHKKRTPYMQVILPSSLSKDIITSLSYIPLMKRFTENPDDKKKQQENVAYFIGEIYHMMRGIILNPKSLVTKVGNPTEGHWDDMVSKIFDNATVLRDVFWLWGDMYGQELPRGKWSPPDMGLFSSLHYRHLTFVPDLSFLTTDVPKRPNVAISYCWPPTQTHIRSIPLFSDPEPVLQQKFSYLVQVCPDEVIRMIVGAAYALSNPGPNEGRAERLQLNRAALLAASERLPQAYQRSISQLDLATVASLIDEKVAAAYQEAKFNPGFLIPAIHESMKAFSDMITAARKKKESIRTYAMKELADQNLVPSDQELAQSSNLRDYYANWADHYLPIYLRERFNGEVGSRLRKESKRFANIEFFALLQAKYLLEVYTVPEEKRFEDSRPALEILRRCRIEETYDLDIANILTDIQTMGTKVMKGLSTLNRYSKEGGQISPDQESMDRCLDNIASTVGYLHDAKGSIGVMLQNTSFMKTRYPMYHELRSLGGSIDGLASGIAYATANWIGDANLLKHLERRYASVEALVAEFNDLVRNGVRRKKEKSDEYVAQNPSMQDIGRAVEFITSHREGEAPELVQVYRQFRSTCPSLKMSRGDQRLEQAYNIYNGLSEEERKLWVIKVQEMSRIYGELNRHLPAHEAYFARLIDSLHRQREIEHMGAEDGQDARFPHELMEAWAIRNRLATYISRYDQMEVPNPLTDKTISMPTERFARAESSYAVTAEQAAGFFSRIQAHLRNVLGEDYFKTQQEMVTLLYDANLMPEIIARTEQVARR